jgi:hypothetical protein
MTKKLEQKRLKIIGLYTMACEAAKQINLIEKCAGDIMKLSDDDDNYDRGGYLITDYMWEENLTEFEEVLDKNLI